MQISATSVCTVNPPTCSHQFLLLLFLTLLTPHYIFIPVVLYVFLKSNKTPDWVLRKPSPWSVLCQRVFTGLTLQLPSVVAMHPVSISLFLCSSVCTRICFKKALNDVKTTRQWTICSMCADIVLEIAGSRTNNCRSTFPFCSNWEKMQ